MYFLFLHLTPLQTCRVLYAGRNVTRQPFSRTRSDLWSHWFSPPYHRHFSPRFCNAVFDPVLTCACSFFSTKIQSFSVRHQGELVVDKEVDKADQSPLALRLGRYSSSQIIFRLLFCYTIYTLNTIIVFS